jgi:hypothetical protein
VRKVKFGPKLTQQEERRWRAEADGAISGAAHLCGRLLATLDAERAAHARTVNDLHRAEARLRAIGVMSTFTPRSRSR